MFNPQEIIFAGTDACNLLCPHCFVSRHPDKLDIEKAKSFVKSAMPQIWKIGFSGGEPFLYLDFLVEMIKFSVENELVFDQIMTNGDWWKDESDLTHKLQQIYDAGYDGKIGLSWDTFHGQSIERIEIFINAVQELFGTEAINIQIVQGGEKIERLGNSQTKGTESIDYKTIPEYLDELHKEIPYYILPQTYKGTDLLAWTSKKWFKDDYCEGPGQILYIHPNGTVAPCCGFANENPQLLLGTIDDSFNTIMKNASQNKMIKICYEIGLKKYSKSFKKVLRTKKQKYPGKCQDICSFCDYICNNL